MKKERPDAPRDGAVLEFKWTVSRGRDSYGYNICTLRVDGRKASSCNGGGYDMKGTSLGNWAASAFSAELLNLKAKDMPAQSHWQPEYTRQCDGKCKTDHRKSVMDMLAHQDIDDQAEIDAIPGLPKLPEDCYECPTCKGHTRQSNDGKRIDDGRYFYGLSFHDPNFDPSKAVIGKDCNDRTLSHEPQEGKTVGEAEAAGVSFGLERYQSFYKASSHQPSKRHTVPLIDGGCGFSSVERILEAIAAGSTSLRSLCCDATTPPTCTISLSPGFRGRPKTR